MLCSCDNKIRLKCIQSENAWLSLPTFEIYKISLIHGYPDRGSGVGGWGQDSQKLFMQI